MVSSCAKKKPAACRRAKKCTKGKNGCRTKKSVLRKQSATRLREIIRLAKAYRKKHPTSQWKTCVKKGAAAYRKAHGITKRRK